MEAWIKTKTNGDFDLLLPENIRGLRVSFILTQRQYDHGIFGSFLFKLGERT